MWYPAAITVAAAAEPVTAAEVKAQSRIDTDADADLITRLITAARAHAERYCAVRFYTQTVAIKCDCFADFVRLPEGPVQSITSISYVDVDGATQTLATSVYELRADGIEASIVLKFNQSWPSIRYGSRITVTAVVGHATVPEDVKHAMLLWIGDAYENRETAEMENWTSFDILLCNHRRGV